MKPADVVRAWVEKFNAGDVTGLCSLYHPNATNHQVVTEPLVGIDAIRKLFEVEYARAEMICNIDNLFEDGEWAIMEWSDPIGLRGCGFFTCKMERSFFSEVTSTNCLSSKCRDLMFRINIWSDLLT